jgi:hypothetical protein
MDMKKSNRIWIIVLLAGTMCLSVLAQDPTKPVVYKPFRAGERLVYELRYGPIVGGRAHLNLKKTSYKGKTAYYAEAKAVSVGLVDRLFNIEDIYASYFDPVTNLPYMAIRDIHEGNYTFYNEVEYFHNDSMVISTKSGKVEVPPNILDMVSTLYYLRRIDYKKMRPGDVIDVETFFSDEIFPFDIRFRGREKVKTKLGTFMCLRFDPVVEPGRIFESEDDMTIYISDDANYLPLQVRFDMLVGSVKCDLAEYENIMYPLVPLDK